MPRNISFMLTTEQIRNQTKTVTRRLGWRFLKAGDVLTAIEKGQGLKKGEKVNRLCQIRVISARQEPLKSINWNDCRYEGFPTLSPKDFIDFFCRSHKGCTPETEVTRIEFEYL